MTDKEIFEKLEAEIERLENYENESVTSSDTRFGWIHGKTFALTSIRVLLDSMQKEPVSEVNLEDSIKESLAQKYIDYTFKRHNIDANSKEGQLIYYAYMHGMNQCLTQLRTQKEEKEITPPAAEAVATK